MNQMTVVPSNKSSERKRVRNDRLNHRKGWNNVRQQMDLMNSKIMLLEQAAGGISGESPER